MMDFAPNLESTRVLQESLNTWCRMTETKDVNKAELDWTLKMLEVLKNMKKRKTKLTIRQKDILAPLNLDENYKYCFKNKGIERELKKLNKHNFAKLQSIRRLTDTGGAISVVTMIKQLQERHVDMTDKFNFINSNLIKMQHVVNVKRRKMPHTPHQRTLEK